MKIHIFLLFLSFIFLPVGCHTLSHESKLEQLSEKKYNGLRMFSSNQAYRIDIIFKLSQRFDYHELTINIHNIYNNICLNSMNSKITQWFLPIDVVINEEGMYKVYCKVTQT